jgi:universal stress protein A
MTFRISRILVPTDFSEHSKNAFEYAVNLAKVFSSEVVLLHVLDERVVENIYHIHELSPERARAELKASAEKGMKSLVSVDFAEGVGLKTQFREGLPPVAVKEAAEELDVDLIVMGTHGRTGLTQLLYGTTADGVLRGAPCPVLTVNP